MPETKKATCLFCSLQCGFAVEVDQGVPFRIDFDPDAPTNKGSLCARGHYNLELMVHPKRLPAASVSRKRVPRATGITKAAGGIAEIKGKGGPDALGVVLGSELSNEDLAAGVRFARDVLGTRNVAVAYDGNDYPLLAGGGTGNGASEDLDDADCFFLIGDVFWGHPCIAKRIISARYKTRSNTILTLNPYRTNTDWFADEHVAAQPGTEPLFLAGLLSAMNVQGAPKIDLAKVAEVTGKSVEQINGMAKGLKQHDKCVVMVSTRLGDSVSGVLTGALASMLADALKGKYVPLLRGGNAVGAHNIVGSERTVPEILKDVRDKKIKGLLVFGPDLLQLYPGAVSTEDINNLDLLVGAAIFDGEVTKFSSVALPLAAWTEADGTYTSSLAGDRTVTRVVAPQGDARTLREHLAAISKELGASLPDGDVPRAQHAPPKIDATEALAGLTKPVGDKNGGIALIENIHPLHRWDGGITGRMGFPQLFSPYCEIWIGEDDAGRLGIEQGKNVTLATSRGETMISAVVTDRMPGGLVAVPTYVADVRGLLSWTDNAGTRWYDVASVSGSVKPASRDS